MKLIRIMQLAALVLTAWLIVTLVSAQSIDITRPTRSTRPPEMSIDLSPSKIGTFCQPFEYRFVVLNAAGPVTFTPDSQGFLGLTLTSDGVWYGTAQPPTGYVCGDQFQFSVSYSFVKQQDGSLTQFAAHPSIKYMKVMP